MLESAKKKARRPPRQRMPDYVKDQTSYKKAVHVFNLIDPDLTTNPVSDTALPKRQRKSATSEQRPSLTNPQTALEMENCKLLEHLKYLEAELKTQRAHQNELLNELGKVRYDLNQCQRVNNTFGREVLLYRELNLRLHSELEDTRKELASANALHLASATEALPPPLPQDSLFGGALHFAHTSMTVHNGGLILSPFQSPHPSPKKLTPARSGGGI